MNEQGISALLVGPEALIKEAMKQLDQSRRKILFVAAPDRKLIGSLTDGDIRRWILVEGELTTRVKDVCCRNPVSVTAKENLDTLKQLFLGRKLSAIPVVDGSGIIHDILFWDDFVQEGVHRTEKGRLEIPVVIMAGGKGTRLEPLTKILPKPLIPIGDKSIVEIIIGRFLEYGVRKFSISVSYRAKLIRAYFEELDPPYEVEFIEEEEPQGTIGALSILADRIENAVFVTNCDIIIDADYADLYNFHRSNGFDMTLVASLMHYRIPYGVCEIEKGGILKKLSEKPEYSLFASTGMYILSRKSLARIPRGEKFNVTQLMEAIRADGGQVGVYPISEKSWWDIGEWHEFSKTMEKFHL